MVETTVYSSPSTIAGNVLRRIFPERVFGNCGTINAPLKAVVKTRDAAAGEMTYPEPTAGIGAPTVGV